jgi:hypothetical protein
VYSFPGLSLRSNPGLYLANAFGVVMPVTSFSESRASPSTSISA